MTGAMSRMTATVPSLGTALCVPNAPPTLPSLEAGSTHDSDSGDSEWQVDLCKWQVDLPCSGYKGGWDSKGLLSFSTWAGPSNRVITWGIPQGYEGICMLTAKGKQISPTEQ